MPVAVVAVAVAVAVVVLLRRKLLHPLLMMKPSSLAPPLTSEVPMLVASWVAELNSD